MLERKMSDVSVASSRDSVTSVLSELSAASRYSTSEDEADCRDEGQAQEESPLSWASPTRWADWAFGPSDTEPARKPVAETKSGAEADVVGKGHPAVGDPSNGRSVAQTQPLQAQRLISASPEQRLSSPRRCSRVNVWMPNNTFEQSPTQQW